MSLNTPVGWSAMHMPPTPTAPSITVDPSSPVPPFEQVRSQIEDLIRAGVLSAGQRLPAIRQLATDLRVAPGTVARAYKLLEESGMVETSRTRGTRVHANQALPEDVRTAAQRYVQAVGSGSLEDALGAVRSAWMETHLDTT